MLRELDLSSNRFQRVPEEIGRLTELRALSFQRNALTDSDNANAIPESVAKLKKLTTFDVSDNTALGYLPRDFGPLEYSSKRKLQLTQQRPKSGALSFFSRKLSMTRQRSDVPPAGDITISVKNTAVPLAMAPLRLPVLSGADTPPPLQPKELYVPPKYILPREDILPPPAPEEMPVGDQSRGLMPQDIPPAMPQMVPQMMPPAMQSVLPYGGLQPNASAGGMHPLQLLLQQAAGQIVPLQAQPLVTPPVQEPARPESPSAQSDCSTDSFESTTEEFGSASSSSHSSHSSRRSQSNRADPSSNVILPTSNGTTGQNTLVPTQVSSVQPPLAAFPGASMPQPQPMAPVPPRAPIAPTIAPEVLQQLLQQYIAGQGLQAGGVNALAPQTMAPNVGPAGASLVPPQFAGMQLPAFGGAAPAHNAAAMGAQPPQLAMPYIAPFGNAPAQQNLFGIQQTGFGATSVLQNPMFAGLLGRIAAGAAQPAFPQPLFGVPQNTVQGRNSRFDYTPPQVISPAQAVFERRGIAAIQATRLKGLSESRPIELKGKALEHCVEEAKQGRLFGQTAGMPRAQILWSLGLMIHRQRFINDLAKSVAETNADRKKNSPDPMDASLVDDPKQIAVVYQTLVSKELGIHGFGDWRSKLDNENEEYQGIFGRVVAPPNFDNLRRQLIDAVFEDEAQSGGMAVASFVEQQGFWKQFQNELQQAEKTSNQTRFGY